MSKTFDDYPPSVWCGLKTNKMNLLLPKTSMPVNSFVTLFLENLVIVGSLPANSTHKLIVFLKNIFVVPIVI